MYAFGIVIDPRFRFNDLQVFSKELGDALELSETDVAEHLSTLKSQIFEIFSIYEDRYSDGTAEQWNSGTDASSATKPTTIEAHEKKF